MKNDSNMNNGGIIEMNDAARRRAERIKEIERAKLDEIYNPSRPVSNHSSLHCSKKGDKVKDEELRIPGDVTHDYRYFYGWAPRRSSI